MTKYEATWSDYSGGKIKEIEVVRETAAQVVVLCKETRRGNSKERTYERRVNKISSGSAIVDTWEKAHEFIFTRATRNAQSIRGQLERANGLLDNVKGMKKPPQHQP